MEQAFLLDAAMPPTEHTSAKGPALNVVVRQNRVGVYWETIPPKL